MRVELTIEGKVIEIEAERVVSIRITEEESVGSAVAPCVSVDTPKMAVEAAGCARQSAAATVSADVLESASLTDDDLFARLVEVRRGLALSANLPPYVIFTDRSLREMVDKRPVDLMAFEAISGVGKVKLARYGEAFLDIIKEASA